MERKRERKRFSAHNASSDFSLIVIFICEKKVSNRDAIIIMNTLRRNKKKKNLMRTGNNAF